MSDLFYAYGVFVLAVASPGPDFTITVNNSLRYGRQAGVLSALGITIGNAIHLSYISVGLGAVLAGSKGLYTGLEILAAGYLVFLGVKSFRAVPTAVAPVPASTGHPFRDGFIINLFNAKAILFWISYFALVFRHDYAVGTKFIFILLLILGIFFWFSTVATVMSQEKIRRAFLKHETKMNKLMALFFFAMGLRVVWNLVKGG